MTSSVNIPSTNLIVSSICLGTGGFGTSIGRDDAFRMLDTFFELGGAFIDTAHVYGDWDASVLRSASERVIGEWMRERGVRDQVVLATKGAHWFLDKPDVPRLSRQDIDDDVAGSLEALRTDRIDLYWLHRDDPERDVEDIMQTLARHKASGAIRYCGASNWKPVRIRAAQDAAGKLGFAGFVADQSLWNAGVPVGPPFGDVTTTWMDDEAFAYHLETGMAAIPYQSQAYGLFKRMYEGTLDQMNAGLRAYYKPEETEQRYDRMRIVMDESGLTITQVTLAYLTSQPFTTVPIVGCRNCEQLADSMTALSVRLTPEQTHFIRTGERPGFSL